jgi:hypothetical protein
MESNHYSSVSRFPDLRFSAGIAATLALLLMCTPAAYGQAVSIQGGNLTLSVTTAVPGSEPTAVINTNATLRYRQQRFAITKVTVSTSCPGQDFTLKVLAVNPQRGAPAPEVTLLDGMPDADFIRDIPTANNTRRTCTLRYTASATYAQGNSVELGPDVHTVTYTLIAQ